MEYRPGTRTATFVGANPLCGGRVDRAVFLVRHPMPSFWGDWQRRRTYQTKKSHDHHSGLSKRAWDGATKKAWEREAVDFYAKRYRTMWLPREMTYGAWLAQFSADHTLVLKFEALASAGDREAALAEALAFAGVDAAAAAVACAFPRADNPATHRPRDPSLVGAATAWTPALLDTVWRIVGDRAARLGYAKGDWRVPTNATAARVDAARLVD